MKIIWNKNITEIVLYWYMHGFNNCAKIQDNDFAFIKMFMFRLNSNLQQRYKISRKSIIKR